MDLDQLKDIWKELDEPAGQHRGQEEIAAMLKKRSQGPIARMKRNLRWELILVIISYSAIITHYFYSFDFIHQEESSRFGGRSIYSFEFSFGMILVNLLL